MLEDLVSTGRLAGTLSGGRQEKGQYIPDIYTQSQNQWVDSFYKQNGYLGKLLRLCKADEQNDHWSNLIALWAHYGHTMI